MEATDRSCSVAVAIRLAPPRYASAADLAVATGEPISCSDNGWIAVIIGKSGTRHSYIANCPARTVFR